MMDLESAIRHCEEVARQNEEDAILYSNCKKYKKNLYEIGLAENAEKKCSECADDHRQLVEWLKELKAYKEQGGDVSRSEIPNTCSDAISRQDVLDAIMANCIWENEYNLTSSRIKKAVENLPSVIPRQRTGRWIQKEEEGDAEPFIIWECSECHCVDEDGKPSYKYCPQCGTRMEVEE